MARHQLCIIIIIIIIVSISTESAHRVHARRQQILSMCFGANINLVSNLQTPSRTLQRGCDLESGGSRLILTMRYLIMNTI